MASVLAYGKYPYLLGGPMDRKQFYRTSNVLVLERVWLHFAACNCTHLSGKEDSELDWDSLKFDPETKKQFDVVKEAGQIFKILSTIKNKFQKPSSAALYQSLSCAASGCQNNSASCNQALELIGIVLVHSTRLILNTFL